MESQFEVLSSQEKLNDRFEARLAAENIQCLFTEGAYNSRLELFRICRREGHLGF